MACYHPLLAYKTASGEVVFCERRGYDVVRTLSLPCGQCIGCRLEKSRQWAMRCMHEASLYERNCFVTLTYNDESLPLRSSLDYPAFQKFMKRLRKVAAPSRPRFYMCGEYGAEPLKPRFDLDGKLLGRPHYHACLFGVDFADKKYWRKSDSGARCYRSATLERLWPFGHSELGDVNFQSAAYVARYCVSKVTGHNAKAHYSRRDGDGTYLLEPEFNHMSLKPGIGARWLEKFQTDVYPTDFVVVNGKECKPPKYYDRLFSSENPDVFEEIQFRRESDARLNFLDNTDERLAVKEIVARARLSQLERS